MEEVTSSSSSAQKRSATEDASSPYYRVSGDNPSAVLVNPQLNGSNFHSWSRSMRIALGAKNKLQLISNAFSILKETDPDFLAWQRCDLMVQSWILNSCTKEVSQCILYADTSAAMWKLLEERFSQGNFPRIFELQKQIYSIVQGNMTVTEYFNKLDSLWRELGQYDPILTCKCGAIKSCTCTFLRSMMEKEDRNMSIKFLMSLNDVYASIRGQILVMKPFPTMNQIFSFVIQDEMQRSVGTSGGSVSDSMAMLSKANQTDAKSMANYSSNGYKQGKGNGSFNQNMKKEMKCTHCGYTNHTIDKCYRLHGFPPGYKSKGKQLQNQSSGSSSSGQNRAYAALSQLENAPKATSDKGSSSVTQEQYKHLLSLIQNLANSHNTPLTPLSDNDTTDNG